MNFAKDLSDSERSFSRRLKFITNFKRCSIERKIGEQLREGEAEAGEHVLAVEGVGRAEEAVGGGTAVNEHRFFPGIQHPRQSCSARKVIFHFLAHLPDGVERRHDLDDQIRRSAKKLSGRETRAGQA